MLTYRTEWKNVIRIGEGFSGVFVGSVVEGSSFPGFWSQNLSGKKIEPFFRIYLP
jgi:hypothetical protein